MHSEGEKNILGCFFTENYQKYFFFFKKMLIIFIHEHNVRNLHFLLKNSTLISTENFQFFGGEKLVKMFWFWTF